MSKIIMESCIGAIATGAGGSIGIIRLSGQEAVSIAMKIFRGHIKKLESRRMYYGWIYDGDQPVDEVMISFMLSPESYTREDVVEINCHGGNISLKRVLELCLREGARLAEPGEFTKRAFLNGRIDLSAAEAVMDTINAETELAGKAAVNRLRGGLYQEVDEIGQRVMALLAAIEANIDYPEYEETAVLEEDILVEIGKIDHSLCKLLDSYENGRVLREGINTVIMGKPNVGKSSLLNRMLDEERAIVTHIPGTTRDVLRERVSLRGLPLNISDTAGIRETKNLVEAIGVKKSLDELEKSDLVLYVVDGSQGDLDSDIQLIKQYKDRKMILVVNKADLPVKAGLHRLNQMISSENIISVSARSGKGIENLAKRIEALFISGNLDIAETPVLANVRQRDGIYRGLMAVKSAGKAVETGMGLDMAAIDLTNAYNAIGEITGRTAGEDVINSVFSMFCLGK